MGGVRGKWWEASRGWSWRGGIGGVEGGGGEFGGVVGVGESGGQGKSQIKGYMHALQTSQWFPWIHKQTISITTSYNKTYLHNTHTLQHTHMIQPTT